MLAGACFDPKAHRGPKLDPKAKASWCLVMAGAGLEDDHVFVTVATSAVDECLKSPVGSRSRVRRRCTRDRWVPGSDPLRPTRMWLAKIATLLGSAGLEDPGLYRKIAAHIEQTSADDEDRALVAYATSDDHLAELRVWNQRQDRALDQMRAGSFGYFSELPMLLTHKADTAMHSHMTESALPPSWSDSAAIRDRLATALTFTHPDRPLVIDIGCGRGSFLLALASRRWPGTLGWAADPPNYLGIERSPFLVRKAEGLASRWRISGTVRFVVGPAELVLSELRAMPEHLRPNVRMTCLQFPTPSIAVWPEPPSPVAAATAIPGVDISHGVMSAAAANRGNSHLPSESSSFLGSPAVLNAALALLAPGGWMYLQTNTEDVAVAMRATLERLCPTGTSIQPGTFDAGSSAPPVNNGQAEAPKRSLRSTTWVARGGAPAEGPGWLVGNPWERYQARTETEAWCGAENFRVYRFLFETA